MEDETVLERRLNGDEEPNHLPLKLLQQITNDFSNERIIGKGGFGAVYKGVLRNGIIVAVKRIDVNIYTVDDKSFRREFNSFYNTNHENVVRFLGFCSNTYKTSIKEAESGNYNLVNINERLLCLEYIRNGSLNEHIADELRGLEWETRYEIIAGICRGLDYLHNIRKIIHMDLKPANILLDGNDMIPKITDFGLSRPNEDSHTTALCFGTPGYLAPEYREGSKGTTACDIYSLGAIIIELVTGCIGVPDQHNVLRRWRHRWSNPVTPLQYQQVIKCVEIAGHCRAREPEDRPSIEKIIKFLSENTDEQTGQESTYLDDDMLGIEPLELHFTFELNKEVSWPVNLTNGTRACFAFKIENPSKKYTIGQDKGIVASGCKCLVEIIVGAPEVTQNGDNFIVWSTKVSKDLTVDHITEHTFHQDDSKVVDKVYLKVLCEPTKPLRSREDTRIRIPVEEVLEKREIAQSASGKGKNKVGSSENATNKMQSQLPRTPIQAGEDIVSGKQSSVICTHYKAFLAILLQT